ncbi:diguanylate cyclase [Caloramator sp. ALD01]|uniref:diguanylate cyclase n=1 Tax=Caloramator sp. ALD01 TaxID=1031288 RepID=UPI00054E01AF|nr:diguanylate cyclase [Caloramator sp. ALD01]
MDGEFFRRIVSRMQNALAYHRIIYENGQAVDYEYVYVNKAFEELTGLKKDYIVGKRASEIKDNQFVVCNNLKLFSEVATNGTEDKIEQYFDVWKRWYSIDVFSPEQGHFGLLFTDITDIKNLTSSLSEQKEVMKQITENLEEITFLMDVKTKGIIYTSNSAEKFTGIPIEAFYADSNIWLSCIYSEDRDRVINRLQLIKLIDYFRYYNTYIEEFRAVDCKKQIKWVRLKCMPIKNEYNEPIRIVGIIQDITKEKNDRNEIIKAKQKAEKLAMFDYLTRVYNRRAFFVRAREEFSRAKRLKKPVAVILTDLDKFKTINDTYGHDVGDLVLKDFSKTIKSAVRKYDVVARFGGEEFVILLSGVDLEDAYRKAENLRRVIEQNRVYSKKFNLHINYTASFGVAAFEPRKDLALEDLITNADRALYKAKNSGRNRVECL